MDKIKTVKIKNEDGYIYWLYSYWAEVKNINMNNTYNVQGTIGNIDVETDGSIAEQLASIINRLEILEEHFGSQFK